MTEKQLQARIDALPKLHNPASYSVNISDKKGRHIDTRIVLASSPERAKLTGYRVNKFIFGRKKSCTATARKLTPGNTINLKE